MQDTYAPRHPARATCPHCGAELPSLAGASPGLLFATLAYRCRGCGQPWNEVRAADTITRLWDPGAAPA